MKQMDALQAFIRENLVNERMHDIMVDIDASGDHCETMRVIVDRVLNSCAMIRNLC